MQLTRTAGSTRLQTARVLLAIVALLATLAAMLAAGHASAAGSPSVKVATTKLGRILVNAQGRTLYMFTADKHGRSACNGACATFWPPLVTSSTHVSGTGVKASLLGTTKRADGKLQVTFDHHPLYLFAKDAKAGQTTGQGLNVYGGHWWVLSPSGTAIKQAPAAAPAPGGGYSGGGGYGP